MSKISDHQLAIRMMKQAIKEWKITCDTYDLINTLTEWIEENDEEKE